MNTSFIFATGFDVIFVCHFRSDARDNSKSDMSIQSVQTEMHLYLNLFGIAFQTTSICNLEVTPVEKYSICWLGMF